METSYTSSKHKAAIGIFVHLFISPIITNNFTLVKNLWVFVLLLFYAMQTVCNISQYCTVKKLYNL